MIIALAMTVSAQASNADRLAQTMPTVAVLEEKRLDATFAPYVECYVAQVKNSPSNDLADDIKTNAMFEAAFRQCELERNRAEQDSRNQIGVENEHVIQAYRRVSVWTGLRKFFYVRNAGEKFDSTFARVFGSRSDHAGKKSAQD